PARPADRVHVLALERHQGAVGTGAGPQALDPRVAVAGPGVLLAPRERATPRASRLPGERNRDVRVVTGAVLGAEAAAHVVADHGDAVLRQGELLGGGVADPPDELPRDVDLERVALPADDRLVRLHRVVQHGLG